MCVDNLEEGKTTAFFEESQANVKIEREMRGRKV
jgi:hypothetical protein